MDEPKTCPYYKGVCGLDESYVCFCSSTYLFCSVYIEAQEKDVEQSLTELKNRCCGRFDDGTRVFLISENEIDGIIESLKKQQPKKGHWQPYKYGDDTWHQCSACGVADHYIYIVKRDGYPDYRMVSKRNFCPNCGADMRDNETH